MVVLVIISWIIVIRNRYEIANYNVITKIIIKPVLIPWPIDFMFPLSELAKGQPVLHLERKMETNVNGLYLYSSIFCNTGKYSIFGRF